MRKTSNSRTFRVCLLALLASLLLEGMLPAQSPRGTRSRRGQAAQQAAGPRDYRSRNFLVHTDLSPEEAQDLLKRLETMLRIISTYWGQPNRKTIECYVVEDLAKWPQGAFPADGLAKIEEGAGVTKSTVLTVNGRPVNSEAIVYAVAEHGTPLHEAVHAYCFQNFGYSGPTWYSEGMAEMGNYWREDDSSVLLPEVVLQYLQESDPKGLLEIVDNTDQTGDSWENYAWRWALCHLLANNENYSKRFRPLGLNLLRNGGGSFEQTYGLMSHEIAFEYRFFLEHLENGLRADLIAWDWKTRFLFPRGSRPMISKIEARGGWQPSRLKVEAGKTYQVTAEGEWQIEKDGDELSADGEVVAEAEEKEKEKEPAKKPAGDKDASEEKEGEDKELAPPPEGAGRLMGVILDTTAMSLGEPFELGSESSFTAESDGQLYFRCADGWGLLGDNAGEVSVRVGVGG